MVSSPEHDLPFAESAAAAASAPSALIETTLQRARISVLHPSRVVIVGDGLRLRIDHHGVTRQRRQAGARPLRWSNVAWVPVTSTRCTWRVNA